MIGKFSTDYIAYTNFAKIRNAICRILPSMPSFLTTSKITSALEDIIEQASSVLTLVTPYIKTNELIRPRLMDIAKAGVKVRIVYGKKDLKENEAAWLRKLPKAEIFFSKNLHAKCYINEHEAIIGSMNLYEFSQQHNDEMGILISARDDSSLYGDVLKEVERIIRSSQKQNLGLKSFANAALAVADKVLDVADAVVDIVRSEEPGSLPLKLSM